MDKIHLPPQVMAYDPDSFARYTVLKRFPQTVTSMIEENDYPQAIVNELLDLREEIAQAKAITPLSASYPQSSVWNEQINWYRDNTWLGVMWYFIEAFFYHRLLDIARYYEPGKLNGIDPFRKLKDRQISADIQTLAAVWKQYESLNDTEAFDLILHSSLWGNRADLSMTGFIDGASMQGLSTRAESEFILVDHTSQARAFLSGRVKSVDVLNDNVGADSLFDLVLTDFLISRGWVERVRFQLKDRPFFISDAMPVNILQTISELSQSPDASMSALGQRLSAYLEQGRFELKSNAFWTSASTFEKLPPEISEDLTQANLLILKGDANYRRLLGERSWPFATPIEIATQNFPFSFLTLRTIKCEILAGLDEETAQKMEKLDREDQFAFVSGKRGLIHLKIK